ncbi:MAG: tRNA epoxyqueuosine(34) reductase QueG [Gammaproteobacteria bacterium]|nr:tRNA epoxyqueuosine(34) reductase QueG [Gammaproteobacteria bacterium]
MAANRTPIGGAADAVGRIRRLAREYGFADAGIARLDLGEDLQHLRDWLAAGHHGTMAYMARAPEQRADPQRLRPGTVSVISLRMDCTPPAADAAAVLADARLAYIARYALGRDYHRLLRHRLLKLAARIGGEIAPHGYRVLTDSAPALEKALARNAGLGSIGKNTLLLQRKAGSRHGVGTGSPAGSEPVASADSFLREPSDPSRTRQASLGHRVGAGSMFLLGEIYTDMPLPADAPPPRDLCGACRACLDICPTKAFTGPYQLDARRCISYLTIENRGPIPVELRPAIGNRIFGCDDCQLVCPWNRYARSTDEPDFAPRHGLSATKLVELFAWSEEEWLMRTEGTALRRATYRGWLRNLAVALGNAPASAEIDAALAARAGEADAMVREHVAWARARRRSAAA